MFKMLFLCLTVLAGPVLADSRTVSLGARSYIIDLPMAAKGAPIILALHGGGGNPAQFARNSGLSRPANAKGYAVIYPAGSGRRSAMLTWNGGYCCAFAAQKNVDDVAFLDGVIADAARQFGIDATRVYVTGMSNGSLMTEVYAAARANRVRAVAAVSGSMDVDHTRITGSVPILVIHGKADHHVPFAGGVGPAGKVPTDWASVDEVVAAFVKAAGAPMIRTDRVIDPVQDKTRVLASDYAKVGGQVMVRLLAIEGGGHVWPGGRRTKRGGGTADIDANREMLRFFALHP